MTLLHGTTLRRAERIIEVGPDAQYCEAGGPCDDGFYVYLESGLFIVDPPEEYARRKHDLFPNEGGPVVLALDVPDEIVERAVDEQYFPLRWEPSFLASAPFSASWSRS